MLVVSYSWARHMYQLADKHTQITEQMAVMCVASIDSIPLMLSLVSLFASIGGAIVAPFLL